jgi:uncharacterized DUF497 family protein
MGKLFLWNYEKNELLKQERNVSFDQVLKAIENGNLLDILQHPNRIKYPNQRIFVIELENYVYVVPFVENETEIFLKTIIPSREMTKKYLKK